MTDEAEALNSLVKVIHKLTEQCPPKFHSEANKTRYLSTAVSDYSWAAIPRGNIVSAKY